MSEHPFCRPCKSRARYSRETAPAPRLLSAGEADLLPSQTEGFSSPQVGDGSLDIDTVTTTSSRAWIRNHLGTVTYIPTSGVSSRVLEKRPATTINPVRPDGTRAPSPYWRRWARFDVSVPGCSAERISDPRYQNGFEGGHTGSPDVIYDSVNQWSNGVGLFPIGPENLARQRLRSKLSDVVWDFGVFAGEIRETAGLFVSAGQRIALAVNNIGKSVSKSPKVVRTFLRDMERTRSVRIRTVNGSVVRKNGVPQWDSRDRLRKWQVRVIDDWLLFQFGVKPLLGDISDAIDFLVALEESGSGHITATVRAGASVDIPSTLKFGIPVNNFGYICPVVTQSACHIAATYGLALRSDWKEMLGLHNPASVAWNLLRFTWIVDYVFGVGKWLDSLALPHGTEFVEGTISRIQKRQQFDSAPLWVDPTWRKVEGRNANIRLDVGRFERALLPPDGVRPPTWPEWRNKLNLTRVANVLAVLTKLMR